jgi:hypothetical protein
MICLPTKRLTEASVVTDAVMVILGHLLRRTEVCTTVASRVTPTALRTDTSPASPAFTDFAIPRLMVAVADARTRTVLSMEREIVVSVMD